MTLHLFENRIADISALTNCKRLEMLSLSQNRLTDLSPLSRCGELAFLSLDRNGLTDISALAHCGTLDELDLSGNQITDISPLSSCVKLRELNLPYNQITDISATRELRTALHGRAYRQPSLQEVLAGGWETTRSKSTCLLLKGGLFTACASSPATRGSA